MKDYKDKALKQRLESSWDVPPLPQGSRERFLDRLEHAKHPRHNRMRLYIGVLSTMAAAILVFVLLLVKPQTNESVAPAQIDLRIAELKGYYKAKLWSESSYIITLTEDMDEAARELLLQEVNKIEHSPDSLVDRLQNEPMSDDLKIYYITQVYHSHLHSMQQIHSMLNEWMTEK